MPRYIDADKATEHFEKHRRLAIHKDDIVAYLADIPTADVVEVKHGHWIEETERIKSIAMMPTDITYYRCSECGRKEHKKEPYCNCGARMDGKDGDEI